jgi:hypothetical protein
MGTSHGTLLSYTAAGTFLPPSSFLVGEDRLVETNRQGSGPAAGAVAGNFGISPVSP